MKILSITAVALLLAGPGFAQNYGKLKKNLMTATDKEFFSKKNLELIARYETSSASKTFQRFYKNASRVDSIMGVPLYAEITAENLIMQETFNPALRDSSKKPDWIALRKKVPPYFRPEEADRALLDEQIYWAGKHHDSVLYLHSYIRKIDRFGPDTSGGMAQSQLNNLVWYYIYNHPVSPVTFAKGLGYSEMLTHVNPAFPLYPGFLDTYAHMLYQNKQFQDAERWEQRAIAAEIQNAALDRRAPDTSTLNRELQKMKQP